jgi:hypothetical protein
LAVALTACGSSLGSEEPVQNAAAAAVDEEELVGAVTQSIDRQAIEGAARGAVQGAIQEALPTAELEAMGAVIDERALAEGLDRAIDGEALIGALGNASKPAEATQEN